ncbi:MAG: hypothetical protein DMG27_18050, partial [Acidobacteria bacterium]
WVANVAFFQILLFAYNLVHWFKRLCLPKEYLYATLDTIRTDFLVLPAKLINRGGQNLGGHLKTGQWWTGQNRPTDGVRD